MNEEDKINDLSYITGVINTMARNDELDFCYTRHCLERQKERNITNLDILHILKFGVVEEYQGKAEHPFSKKVHRYKIVGEYLGNEDSIREIGLIILVEIDKRKNPAIKIQKIVTTMWKDL